MSVEFIDNSLKIKGLINDKTLAWLREGSAEIESQTKRNTSVDSGKTKGSWTIKIDEAKGESYIGSSEENSIWEENGTGEYALNHDGRTGGWVYKDPKTGKFIRTLGKQPKRALYKAYKVKKSVIIKRAEVVFKEIGK